MTEELLAADYQPRSELIVPVHHVDRSKFPCIDAHNHLPADHPRMSEVDLGALVAMLDECNVQGVVNLSGGWGDRLQRNLDVLDRAYPGRFYTFCNVHWGGAGSATWERAAVSQLEADVRAGARGLKVFKQLGLSWRDADDNLLMPDDERLGAVWDKAGELDIPVLIHVADPVAFFRPLDRFNERWDELHAHPNWHFYGDPYPAFEVLIESLYRLMEAHRNTTFITAHVGCYPENLAFVSEMLETHPNFYTDISARIAELGRAPYSAREWFLKYPDRILFGTDATPNAAMYRVHYRFMETADEYFNYTPGDEGIPPQGRWRIYGMNLPDEVLSKVYRENTMRLLHIEA